VRTSDAERTLLDLLDYPEIAGGMLAAIEFVRAALPRVDSRKLVEYSIRGSRLSTGQRLGVLLERTGSSERTLRALQRHLRRTASRLSMVPGSPRRGHLNRRWNVVENDVRGAA
jgi:predicted transcriptional regulator of viral defense system